MKVLSPDLVATDIVAVIEKGARATVKPAAFRFLFLLNSLFPKQTEESMCKPGCQFYSRAIPREVQGETHNPSIERTFRGRFCQPPIVL